MKSKPDPKKMPQGTGPPPPRNAGQPGGKQPGGKPPQHPPGEPPAKLLSPTVTKSAAASAKPAATAAAKSKEPTAGSEVQEEQAATKKARLLKPKVTAQRIGVHGEPAFRHCKDCIKFIPSAHFESFVG